MKPFVVQFQIQGVLPTQVIDHMLAGSSVRHFLHKLVIASPRITAPDRRPACRYPRSKTHEASVKALKAWARSFPETAGSGWPGQKDLHKDNGYDKSFAADREVLRSCAENKSEPVACQRLFY